MLNMTFDEAKKYFIENYVLTMSQDQIVQIENVGKVLFYNQVYYDENGSLVDINTKELKTIEDKLFQEFIMNEKPKREIQ